MRTARAIFVFAFFLHLSLSAGASDRLGAGLSSLPPTAQSSISAALGRDIGDYRVQVQAAGLHAESSEHMLAADFTADGVEVRGGGAHWRMKLYGFGYGDAIKAIESVTPKADLNRVEYRHESLAEWYVNGPSGLEQGFTINDRPGSVEGQPLTVALDVPASSSDAEHRVEEAAEQRVADRSPMAAQAAGLSARSARRATGTRIVTPTISVRQRLREIWLSR